jgi:hypothetical protein
LIPLFVLILSEVLSGVVIFSSFLKISISCCGQNILRSPGVAQRGIKNLNAEEVLGAVFSSNEEDCEGSEQEEADESKDRYFQDLAIYMSF